eukprot:CAMPEP_0179425564 /NCGR_PEP_ID=MMETSP0799-20121207/12238_1 /TAXON_ID=46947 /ORGANISM="Geminigera cryophila, Strain CCMP2564" /LENGTH=72 /DNA_ID=CAMNT_0021200189 /DNA_START=917 /DNA_END=1135 /DNA_ORIENTATION=-
MRSRYSITGLSTVTIRSRYTILSTGISTVTTFSTIRSTSMTCGGAPWTTCGDGDLLIWCTGVGETGVATEMV